MRYRRNADETIRSLERLWATGDIDAGLALQAWKRRTEPVEVPSISSLPDLSEGIHMYAADLYCKDCGEAIRADLLQGELSRIDESGYDHQLPQVMCNNTLCDYRAPITQAVIDSDGDYQCGNDCNWPNVQLDEHSYDSDDFPKWGLGIGESDSVRHCGSHGECLNAIQIGWGLGGEPQLIGGWLGNELTEEGVASVVGAIQDNPEGFVARLWAELYSDHDEIAEAAGDDEDDDDEEDDARPKENPPPTPIQGEPGFFRWVSRGVSADVQPWNGGVTIYDFGVDQPGKGHGARALVELRNQFGPSIVVMDPTQDSLGFWRRMHERGLVDAIHGELCDTNKLKDEDENRRNPRPPLDLNHKMTLFTIWWLRQKHSHAYYPEVASLMQKVVEDEFELGRILRRLQDQGYLDARPGGYFLYQPGSEIAWEMAKASQDYGRLPDLRRRNPDLDLRQLRLQYISAPEDERAATKYIRALERVSLDTFLNFEGDNGYGLPRFQPVSGFYERNTPREISNREMLAQLKDDVTKCERKCSTHQECVGCGGVPTKFTLRNGWHVAAWCDPCWDARCICDEQGVGYCPNHQGWAEETRCGQCGTNVNAGEKKCTQECSLARRRRGFRRRLLPKMTTEEYADEERRRYIELLEQFAGI
jgi:hypothetical protein